MIEVDFTPARGLRSGHVQAVLSSGPLRRALLSRRQPEWLRQAKTVILDCGDGVRLQGHYSAQDNAKGLVIMLHGWEGSADSTYQQDAARHLFEAGFDLFRLNFRDHGNTHHLNQELFHSCRLAEVVGAVKAISDRFSHRALLLSGFSLGGNFALRVALNARDAGIELQHVMSVCPPISPKNSLRAIESAPWIYNTYFLKKWRRSLRAKQAIFPDHYNFDEWISLGLLDTTARLVERFTEFDSVDDYFDGYSIAGDRLAELSVPTTILAAVDDAVIPISDFQELTLAPNTQLQISRFGGHCGFLENWRLDSWASRHLTKTLLRAIGINSDQVDQSDDSAPLTRQSSDKPLRET